jgi:hypothetical protein
MAAKEIARPDPDLEEEVLGLALDRRRGRSFECIRVGRQLGL